MDLHVGQVNSVVRATDAEALLTPAVLERIVQTVLARVEDERRHAERAAAERAVAPPGGGGVG